MTRPGLGLLPPDGRHDAAMAAMAKPMCAATDAEIPDDVDPADSLTVNDQGQRNSCDGNAVDKALECDYFNTTGQAVNFSARFSYLAARVIDGTNDGPDAGATIHAGALAALKMGRVTEEAFPYWRDDEDFDPTLPAPILQMGLKGLAKSIVQFQSMDELIRFIGTRQGGVTYGMHWTEGLMAYRGEQPIGNSFGGGSVGLHALAICGYRTINGRKWPKTWNSHSKRWGDNGTMTTHPDLLWDAILAAGCGAYGISLGAQFVKKPFPGFANVF